MSTPTPPLSSVVFKITNINPVTTIGLGYLGVVFSSILYGLTCYQTFNYCKTQLRKSSRTKTLENDPNKSDRPLLKALVAVVFILDTTHQILVTFTFYHYLILDFANPVALFLDIWAVPASIILVTITGTFVYAYISHRVWSFSKHKRWVVGASVIWLIAMTSINLMYPIKQFYLPIIASAQEGLESIGIAALSVSAAGDAFMAIVMTVYLIKELRETSRFYAGTDRASNFISKMLIFTVGTGTLTTFFELASLIAYFVAPLTLFNLFFNIMLSKLYSNSMLTLLNTRDYLHNQFKKPVILSDVINRGLQDLKSVDHSLPPNISFTVSHSGLGSFLVQGSNREREYSADASFGSLSPV